MSTLVNTGTSNPCNTADISYAQNSYNSPITIKESCTEIYKQLLWYNLKKFGKDTISEEQHKNMLSMLNSNDNDTLELLRQILTGKAIE
jgi:hypothetical protein